MLSNIKKQKVKKKETKSGQWKKSLDNLGVGISKQYILLICSISFFF